ncbi:cupredoxin domain-containing protein [Lactobacillus corticis]|uniref:Copper-binding protein n=1 Tax=Lactobacillus corticis TaxID=2201249 RepID=A0A916QJ56_9LACO|nr:cupredoxin domain-containing protein [Lactobacillus corticis]GFZ26523.1 copper-binding protein [Lactobacillus corticis]
MSLFSKKQNAKIVVDGGYKPEVVHFKQGQPAQVAFHAKNVNGCLSHVVFKDLNVDSDLTAQKVTKINIPTDKPGEYNFACGMDMFHGKIVID